MKKSALLWNQLLWAVLVVTLVGIGAKTIFKSTGLVSKKTTSENPDNLPLYGKIPDFSLTEQNGKQITEKDLLGKVWIADFVFTHCAGPCPLMSGIMKELQKKLEEESDIRLVSFSVDPERDTPQVLSEYAKRYQANPEKWFFLTGDKTKIHQLSMQHFHLAVGDVPLEDREARDQNVYHSTKFVLVDKQGKIRGYYSTQPAADLNRLADDARKLLKN